MSKDGKGIRGILPVLLVGSICVALSLFSSAIPAGAAPLQDGTETLILGGGDCSGFMNGAAVGLGIGALFGCLWCAGGAIAAKGIALFC
jgi:hypothetical protein